MAKKNKKAKLRESKAEAADAVEDAVVATPAPAKKQKQDNPTAVEEKQPAATAKAAPAAEEEEEADAGDRREDVFRAAAVAFFTRDAKGAVEKVLVCIEERKVQASYIGLPQKGKVMQRMVVFPMGRREKKDKSDGVETARREYVEETGDYGGLAQYLDFADFEADEDEGEAEQPKGVVDMARPWTGKHNMALFFVPAGMMVLFCEVPRSAAEFKNHAAAGGIPHDVAAAREAAAKAQAEAEAKAIAEGKSMKKRKKADPMKPSPSYHVGQTDHLAPQWLSASDLRKAMESGERSPILNILGEDCRVYPTACGVLRFPEARKWLGIAAKTA